MADLFSNLVGFYGTQEEAERSDKSIAYFIGPDGTYERRMTELGPVIIKADKIMGAAPVKQGVDLSFPKVPFVLLKQILSCFRKVSRKHNAEVMIQIWWDKTTEQYSAICPKQVVSPAHVSYKRDVANTTNRDNVLVAEIHSHNFMGGFFSDTDNKDEIGICFYGVIGKVNDDKPEIKFRMGVRGNFLPVGIFSVFEKPEVIDYSTVEFPQEWLESIEVLPSSEYKASTYTGSYGKSSYGKGSKNLSPSKEFDAFMKGESLSFFDKNASAVLSVFNPAKDKLKNSINSLPFVKKDKDELDIETLPALEDQDIELSEDLSEIAQKILSLKYSQFNALFTCLARYVYQVDMCNYLKTKGIVAARLYKTEHLKDENESSEEVKEIMKMISDVTAENFMKVIAFLMKEGCQAQILKNLKENGYSLKKEVPDTVETTKSEEDILRTCKEIRDKISEKLTTEDVNPNTIVMDMNSGELIENLA